MLQATDLCCVRGERQLFAGLGFSLAAGGWLHVTGDNGVGKTTLLRTLCGLASPEVGEICWNGVPIGKLGDDYRGCLLYLGHQAPVKEELSPRENLQSCAAVKGWDLSAEDAGRALDKMGLAGREDLPARFLSQGQKRRVALAQLIAAREPLWILDEPFAALDGGAVNVVTQLISEHLAGGGMAILTSHQPVKLPAGSGQARHLAG